MHILDSFLGLVMGLESYESPSLGHTTLVGWNIALKNLSIRLESIFELIRCYREWQVSNKDSKASFFLSRLLFWDVLLLNLNSLILFSLLSRDFFSDLNGSSIDLDVVGLFDGFLDILFRRELDCTESLGSSLTVLEDVNSDDISVVSHDVFEVLP